MGDTAEDALPASRRRKPAGKAGAVAAVRATVLRRLLPGRDIGAPGLSRLIACIETEDERRRFVFGSGTRATAFEAAPSLGHAVVESLVEVAGSTLVTARGPGPLALADGGRLDAPALRAEPGLLADRNTLLGCRIGETAAQVADHLIYHARSFGASGALIIDRAPDADPDFDAALRLALAGIDMTVVLLGCTLPLGKPDTPAQTHVTQAPGAPGLARIERPAPDRWRAALGEPLLYEAAKWAFLSQARAVLALDVTDVLAPDAPNPFELCRQAAGGCIALTGTPAYPWRVKPGQPARFGDHICRPFAPVSRLTRWGVSPRRAGLGRIWRLVRIAETAPQTLPAVPFFRAMAIRIPDEPTARLVPKTSIIEDPMLLALATDHFGHNPARPPKTAIRPAAAKDVGQLDTVIVTTMKNEGPFLLEWIAYHRVLGVTGFLVYTNDCTDGTDSFLALLQAKGLCQHRENPWRPGGSASPQYAALQAAEAEPVMQAADWLICMDVDEYINVKIGDGTLPGLFTAMGEANMISLTWRLFGHSDVVRYEDRPVLAQFDRCAPEIVRKPHQAWGFKTLFRNIEIFRKFGVHRPKGLKPDHWDRIHWLNGSGRPMPNEMLRNGWRSTLATYGYDWVQLNHYAVRSVESFLVKRDRGRVNHIDRDQGRNYWFRMSHNAEADHSVQRMLAPLQAEMDRLLADPEIRAAHDLSVARHREKIAELMARADSQALFAELTGARMNRLCRMQQHFGSAVFSAGPQVIPDEIALNPDLPPDFFFTVPQPGEASH
ncbi:glycosyltransferase family 2 protein [Rhodobacter sp. Har01]|uniref:glycosyltransferase family 2 protein n=1 Tax=Rhodobacter sp. Har01 TaxID=2883999 RepID=UPI001D07653C|nr:glycosyltransferase family 2 protein [Rhodobacter sp. Har01]MCB6176729.1 glycosyltransferase family 2 protein [Rhodobacter sp. Har01]